MIGQENRVAQYFDPNDCDEDAAERSEWSYTEPKPHTGSIHESGHRVLSDPTMLRSLLSYAREMMNQQRERVLEFVTSQQLRDDRAGSDGGGSKATSVAIPVNTLAPEPFVVIVPFSVFVEGIDGDYTATLFDANIGASGETRYEAIENLKELLVMSFESLEELRDEQLGPSMLKQKCVLASIMRRK